MALPAHPLLLVVRALIHPERRGGGRERVRVAAFAHTRRGVSEAVSRRRLSPWWLPCAAVCSVLLVPLLLASVVEQLLSAANLRDGSVVCLSRKGVKRRSFKVLWLFGTPCLLISLWEA